METLYSLVPDPDHLLTTPIEDLAPLLLRLAMDRRKTRGEFQWAAFTETPIGDLVDGKAYPPHCAAQVERHLNAGLNWLKRNGFIDGATGYNRQNGWLVLTEAGQRIAEGLDLRRVMQVRDFPRNLLHPRIRDEAMRALTQSAEGTARAHALSAAVREAFVTVEVAVRKAGSYPDTYYGTMLMKKAFDPDTGPMGDRNGNKPMPERKGLMELFCAAMARFRNPTMHTLPDLSLEEAQDQLLLASQLSGLSTVGSTPELLDELAPWLSCYPAASRSSNDTNSLCQQCVGLFRRHCAPRDLLVL